MFFLWCFVFACWWVWRKWRYFITYWKVGSRYPALPFLGHIYLIGNKETILQRLFRVGEHAISNGGHSAGWLLDELYIMLADAADTEYILKNHLEKSDFISILREFTRTSLLFTPVLEWRPHRKILTSLLSHKNVSKFEPVFARSSEALVQELRPHAGEGAFSIWKHFSDYAVDTTCSTILGIEFKNQGRKKYLTNSLHGIGDKLTDFAVLTVLHLDWLMKRTRFYGTFTKYDDFIKTCVDEALDKHERDAATNSDTLDEEQHSSLLHMFLRLKEQQRMSQSMLYDESLGMLLAASDTTAMTASIVAVVLARKPDVQEKIYQELKEVFGESERPVTLEDLPCLKYMDAAIKETMRLFPSIPHIARKVLVDTTLPSGISVPKGTNFGVSIYALNRNPKYWGADAEEFRPERFLGSDVELPMYFAFSHGPRGCLGSQYAMMSMKTVLATLLRQYRLLPVAAPLRLQFGIVLREVDDCQVRIEART